MRGGTLRFVALGLFAAGMSGAASSLARAWDYPGHRIVGAIADRILEQNYPESHKRVMALIARTDANGNVVGKRTLAQVAVFPDCARPNSLPFCGRPPSEEEIAYATRNRQHAKFHHTDLPLEQAAYVAHSAGTDDLDVVQMIGHIVLQLGGKTPPAKRGVDLSNAEAVWLLAHLVADIHQPLHVGAPYFDKTCIARVDPNATGQPPTFGIGSSVAGTFGGSRIALVAPPPAVPTAPNLHLYWDTIPVVRAMQADGLAGVEREFARTLASTPPGGWKRAGAPDTWAAQWASEIMPLALEAHQRLTLRKSDTAAPLAGRLDCSWETTVDAAYEAWAKDHARIQIAKAGFRLAALLRAIFEP